MKFFVVLKLIVSTIVQIEASPQYWSELGFTHTEVQIIVISLSLIVLMINISIIKLGIYILGVKNGNSKPRLGHKIANIIHTWGPFGLLLAGLIPWPLVVGVAQPLTYLLYCKVERKIWYKPNIGLLSLMIGVVIKMFLFI